MRSTSCLRSKAGEKVSVISRCLGAEGGTRTPTVLLPPAPQAGASANSATSAWRADGSAFDRLLRPRKTRRYERATSPVPVRGAAGAGAAGAAGSAPGADAGSCCAAAADHRSRTALSENAERERADDEQHRAHGRRARQHRGAAARAERRLARCRRRTRWRCRRPCPAAAG